MKFYYLLIRYRFWLSLVAIFIGILLNVTHLSGFWTVSPLYFLGVIGLAGHFFIGPLRLVEEQMEAGNVEAVEKILALVWFPNLLYKPIRSGYYTIKGNLSMMNKDYDQAEKYLKQSSSIGTAMPHADSSNKLQLGMMAMQKGDLKTAEGYYRAAIRLGFADKDSEAVAFLSMSQIFMQKRQFKAGRDFFRKAKECKPKSKEIIAQIKEVEKYISRVQ
jgi:tetratricopeptide (TPR) repeat protein